MSINNLQCQPRPSELSIVQRWRTDTCLPFSCKLYDVVTGKEPRLRNCPPSSCHGVLHPRYYRLVGTFSCKTAPARGTRGVVLLSPRVWKGCHCLGTRDWYLLHYSNPFITGGQKHTHRICSVACALGALCAFTIMGQRCAS